MVQQMFLGSLCRHLFNPDDVVGQPKVETKNEPKVEQ